MTKKPSRARVPSFFINGVRHEGGYSAPEITAAIEDAMENLTLVR